jgi:gag-polypeptide of LTR copia-type
MDGKALSTIQLCLSNSTLQEILSEKTAKGLWEKLENIFMKKSLTNRLRLKLRLYTLRMEESTSISNHITEFTSILNDLDRLGVKVEDEDQALLLLCSLPASYKTLGI